MGGVCRGGSGARQYLIPQSLAPKPPRRESGYRQYSQDTIARIQFIKRAKDLGFTLKEISELLFLRFDPDTNSGDVKRRAEAKIADIEQRIKILQRMKLALKNVSASCRGQGPTSECPILEALDYEEKAQC